MIKTQNAKVFYSSGSNRRYFTLDSAIEAECRSIISKRYPEEPFEPETGHYFHWREIKRSDVMFRRLKRIIKNKFKSETRHDNRN